MSSIHVTIETNIDRKIVLVLAQLMPELQRGLVNESVERNNLKHFH